MLYKIQRIESCIHAESHVRGTPYTGFKAQAVPGRKPAALLTPPSGLFAPIHQNAMARYFILKAFEVAVTLSHSC